MAADNDVKSRLLSDQLPSVTLEYSLMREFVHFREQGITNLYVIPSHSSPFRWFGVTFIHEGLYRGAIIRFSLEVPHDYPDTASCPKIFFEPIVFHPLINPQTGELNTKYKFYEWKRNDNHLSDVLMFAKTIFTQLNDVLKEEYINSKSNDLIHKFYAENVKLYRNNFEEFKAKVTETVAECHNKLFDKLSYGEDQNAFVFGPWNPEIHEELRKKLIAGKNVADEILESVDDNNRNNSSTGLSWVQKGSLQMFSKSFT
ncbi:AKT-interacting protein-like protein [Dinothrombium tinctorium]|uniref:AKT-interacting protein-like protein n=1 Tax=Dinothrombium tinctorium TaxID=1965070 RepID=A0A3S3P277_9ACAR|nr:AKT-interacting protein-like protein [Dinothrombium tinctorium]RWS10550.1 AKT-interacting protein-like protein [Dinothrombium tinctorium]RWS13228.1 AKT-interacting protein-like protein [Dinothrombium tinctorium]RWS16693.1 AKT-interacting protein-like protein [Dinothrombium tinctorium]